MEKGFGSKGCADSSYCICCAVGNKCPMVTSLLWKSQHIWWINNGTDTMGSYNYKHPHVLSYI